MIYEANLVLAVVPPLALYHSFYREVVVVVKY